jgi:hypothetical protein
MKKMKKTDELEQKQFVEVMMNGQQFKNQIMRAMLRPQAMPMFVVWWDDEAQWCSAIENDLKNNPAVRKQVGGMVMAMVSKLGLMKDVATKAD